MDNLRIIKNKNENGIYYTVVFDDGIPINNGHFTNENDAKYVIEILNNGSFSADSDNAGNICRSMKSYISI